jgi:hypothetical protein
MRHELKAALETIRIDYASYFRFDLLVGSRPSESVMAVNMLSSIRWMELREADSRHTYSSQD